MYKKIVALREYERYLTTVSDIRRHYEGVARMAHPLSAALAKRLDPSRLDLLINRWSSIPHLGIQEAEAIVDAYKTVPRECKPDLMHEIRGILEALMTRYITCGRQAIKHIRHSLPLHWLIPHYLQPDQEIIDVDRNAEIYRIRKKVPYWTEPIELTITIISENFGSRNATMHPIARAFTASRIGRDIPLKTLDALCIGEILVIDDFDSWGLDSGYTNHQQRFSAGGPIFVYDRPAIKVSVNKLIYEIQDVQEELERQLDQVFPHLPPDNNRVLHQPAGS